MTSLSEESKSSQLELSEGAMRFLNFPYKEQLMSQFLIGCNKMKLYGQLFTMSENSELIKTSLPALANSPQPYELASFATVLEKPMTLVWLEMNGLAQQGTSSPTSDDEMPRFDRTKQLTLTEWLHMYRLMSYFGTRLESFNFGAIPLLFIESSSEELSNVLKDSKNVATFITLLNKAFGTVLSSETQRIGGRKLDDLTFEKLLKEYPDIVKQLNYIPVYIDDKYDTFAERKATIENLEKSNSHFTKSGDSFIRNLHLFQVRLTPTEWGPDKITFKSTLEPTQFTGLDVVMSIADMIGRFMFSPIVTGK
jgi:hypothetical protein